MTALYEISDDVCRKLRGLAIDPEADGPTYDLLMDTAYIVEAALAAVGYLRNAQIDLESGATKATAINTIKGGIRKLENAFEQTRAA